MSCVTIGACRTRNHTVTIRMTLTKTSASPAPSTARATTAIGNVVANAKASCPAVISTSPPMSSRREP